jgi:hypothetical protein
MISKEFEHALRNPEILATFHDPSSNVVYHSPPASFLSHEWDINPPSNEAAPENRGFFVDDGAG